LIYRSINELNIWIRNEVGVRREREEFGLNECWHSSISSNL